VQTRDYVWLAFLGICLALVTAWFQKAPGYMDADYYYANGIQLASGKGFTEPFLWNYLDGSTSLPHPSHTYWMPLTSILAAGGMVISGQTDYFSARLLFIQLAAFIPVVTALVSWQLQHDRIHAWLAAALALFCGYYINYFSGIDAFSVYILLGSTLLLWIAVPEENYSKSRMIVFAIGAGMAAGGMYLARNDGLLWLAAGLVWSVWRWLKFRNIKARAAFEMIKIPAFLFGASLVVFPWFIHNLNLFGWILPPGTNQAFWLTDYDQIFSYPPNLLSFNNWLQAGWGAHLQTWVSAFATNAKTVLAVQGSIILLPLILIGAWRLRKRVLTQWSLGMWAITIFVMTIVFPLAGARGGFFHSGSALQASLWAFAPAGLDGLIELGVRLRNWERERAFRGFAVIVLIICASLTIGIYFQRAILDNPGASWQHYSKVETALEGAGANKEDIVLVNNPPGYYLATGREAIVVPYGNESNLLLAADQFHAKYLVLEKAHVVGLNNIYQQPTGHDRLVYLETIDGTQLFRIADLP
jgi:hypothetical protein